MAKQYPTQTQPPATKAVLIDVPAPHVLLITINRPGKMNSLSVEDCWEMDRVWKWFDDESELRVGIITGAGTKALSAGMDLKEAQFTDPTSRTTGPTGRKASYPDNGFAGLTRRVGKKPIICACNGHAHGGGFEIALNSDLVLASPAANFRLPDVLRGTAAMAGAFPRICRNFGLQRAMLLALTGYTLRAEEAVQWGLVQRVVPQEELIEKAVEMASLIASMSPDSVIVSRAGVREAWETASVDRAVQLTHEQYGEKLMAGENVLEGMRAFKEKRLPKWVPSKL
ncbi:carnitinyl-CoA dehydratase [Phlyctema vagabunda]|uniref:Carnitinyl-CoA dehydratase n=1 Tax=Phlyctema vagabunda TaxID=108571 RepID=A0ABR4PVR9_9HELO